MVIGAFVGAAVWRLLEPVVPSLGHDPPPYVIVGMMGCFGSIARAPLAVMLMVAEMTGSLTMIVPAMVAVGLATLIVRRTDDTIYRSQLRSRADSPAHRLLSGLPLLGSIATSRAARAPRCVIHDRLSVGEALEEMRARAVPSAPLVDDDGRYLGVVDASRLAEVDPGTAVAESGVVDTSVSPMLENRPLDGVLESLTSWGASWLAVVDDERRVVGTISVSDIVTSYRRSLQQNLENASTMSKDAGLVTVTVDPSSALCGAALRAAHLPHGMLITAIERGRDVVVPTGDTHFEAHDRLTAIGAAADLQHLRRLADALPRASG